MEQSNHSRVQHGDEITLRDLILQMQVIWKLLWRKMWLIILVGLVTGLAFGVHAFLTPPTYKAKLTFMVNEDSGSSVSDMAAILGRFGIGGARRSGPNLEKVKELAKSRRILQEALFDSTHLNGQHNYLANQLLEIYEFHKKWKKSKRDELAQFYFTHDNFEQFDTTENRVLLSCYSLVKGNAQKDIVGLMSISYGEETGILNLSVSAENEEFSLNLVKRIYYGLSKFYVDKAIERHQSTYDNISAKTDSIHQQLRAAEYQLAQWNDRNTGVYQNRENLFGERLSKKVQMYGIMYGESVRNRETALFLLENETPYFQVIDMPVKPLPILKPSILLRLITGGMIGFFLTVVFFIISILYAETMRAPYPSGGV